MRQMYSEKPLENGKKSELLASLNSLDCNLDLTEDVYQPSFVSNMSSARSGHSSEIFGAQLGLTQNDNPFNSSAMKSLDSSMNSSVKSVVSLDSDKKSKLMKELFSAQN
jgi:hypothetical protein